MLRTDFVRNASIETGQFAMDAMVILVRTLIMSLVVSRYITFFCILYTIKFVYL